MASLGAALVSGALAHSQAEKAFLPWWDKVEDLLVYGLIMLGLVLLPTSLLTGSLECTLQSGQEDPGHQVLYVRRECTVNGSVPTMVLYLPYILLSIAFSLVMVEKTFMAVFSANRKVEKLHQVLLDGGILGSSEGCLDQRKIAEVQESFALSPHDYRTSYLLRTTTELLLTFPLLLLLLFSLLPSLSSSSSLSCTILGSMYTCSGLPVGFYLSISILSILTLLLHLVTNLYNLHWLLQLDSKRNPLVRVLFSIGDTTWFPLLDTPDFCLLLSLLTVTSGSGVGLRALALLNQTLQPWLELPMDRYEDSLFITLPLAPSLVREGLRTVCLVETVSRNDNEVTSHLVPWEGDNKVLFELDESYSEVRCSALVEGVTVSGPVILQNKEDKKNI